VDETTPLQRSHPITIELRAELGERRMHVSELLELAKGQVLELHRLVDAPIGLYAGEQRLARGELVIADEAYALRIIDVAAPPAPPAVAL
jgi:flagellar motor switch protein FliN